MAAAASPIVREGPHSRFYMVSLWIKGAVKEKYSLCGNLERERKYMRAAAGDFEGVLLTIGEERSNRKVENIPIEHVVHE